MDSDPRELGKREMKLISFRIICSNACNYLSFRAILLLVDENFMAMWRNWQTRVTQNHVSSEVWVRVPPSLPLHMKPTGTSYGGVFLLLWNANE